LNKFEEYAGIPVLLNTSFNLAGDPLVETPHDAITTFLASSLDGLVIENHYITERSSMLKDRREKAV
jgi:carbamoyltransferase